MANYKEWFLQIKDMRNQRPIDDDSGVANILSAGTPTELSIVDRFGTALANPLTFSDGKLNFFTDKSVTSLDITLITASGYALYATSLDNSEHSLWINREDRKQVLFVPFGASDNTEVDTGFDLPANMLVTDCHLRVTTTDATETIEVGLLSSESGGDADGFLNDLSVANAGVVTAYPVVTNGSNIDYHDTTATYGVFLSQLIAGADAVATVGGFERRYKRTDGVAKSITYTGSSGSDTAAGFIVFEYLNLV